MENERTENRPSLIARARQMLSLVRPKSQTVWLGIGLCLFAVFTSLLVSRIPLGSLPEYQVGENARADINTPVELIVVDPERTERLRQEEARKVPPVFRFNPGVTEEVIEHLRRSFAQTHQDFLSKLEATFKRRQLSPRERRSARFLRFIRSFESGETTFPVDGQLAQRWAQAGDGLKVRDRLISKLRGVMGHYIRSDQLAAGVDVTRRVYLLPVIGENGALSLERVKQSPTVDWSAIYTLSQAKAELRKMLTSDDRAYADFLAGLVTENCFYAEKLTRQMRDEVSGHITATNHYNPRQLIVQRGQRVTPQIKAAIDQLRAQTASKRSGRRFAGLMLLALILFSSLWQFAKRTRVHSLTSIKTFSLAGFAIVLQVAAIRLGIEITDIIGYRFFGDIDSPQSYQYAIPVAAAALLAVLLLESRIAAVVGLVVSLFMLLLTEDASLTTYTAVSSLVAVFGVGHYQQRGAITRAGVIIGGVNALMAVILTMVNIQPLVFGPVIFSMGCGLLGGIFAAALASFALPLGESLFDILTDVKLLELSNAELPLLKRLAIEAPGTYQHSFIVATLAEAAAKAVGANALLVRIGSYYHDVGKLSNPHMYVENQRRQFNPHELLSPEESASVIIKHVTEGIRMAQQAGLPKPVIDLIPQHHGTRYLHYFWVKAEQLAEREGKTVDVDAFRYPGPKPQSIEAAIVMMADSAEASSRSLKDPGPENLDRLLTKVLDTIIMDGQLDECNLRMRDLKVVKSCFIDTLSNIYHHRIPYPGFTEKELAVLPPANYESLWVESAESNRPGDGGVRTGND